MARSRLSGRETGENRKPGSTSFRMKNPVPGTSSEVQSLESKADQYRRQSAVRGDRKERSDGALTGQEPSELILGRMNGGGISSTAAVNTTLEITTIVFGGPRKQRDKVLEHRLRPGVRMVDPRRRPDVTVDRRTRGSSTFGQDFRSGRRRQRGWARGGADTRHRRRM